MHLPRLTAALAVLAGAAVFTPQALAASDAGSPLQAAADAYRAAYPQLTAAQAATAAAEQPARKALYSSVPLSQYGGAWYDAPSNTVHINATTQTAADAAQARGRELDLDVVTRVVGRTFADLQRQADAQRESNENVGIDVKTNRVVTAAPRTTVVEDACTARNACDTSVRAGIRVWRGAAGTNICSVGFTGRDFATNYRWMILAGHCTGPNGLLLPWGTVNSTIGPMIASTNSGAIDASAVLINDPAYSGQAGGQIYRDVAFGGTVRVDAAADLLTDMTVGDTVCLSANTTELNGPNYCGVLGSISDPAVRGMARIDGMDACGGDSGGGWYGLSGSTRTAYGIHSRSDSTCHAAGGDSWFTPWATVKSNLLPGVDIET